MGSIVVFDRNVPADAGDADPNENARIAGMAALGRKFDELRGRGLSAQALVELAITDLLDAGMHVECEGHPVRRVNRRLVYTTADGREFKLNLQARPDSKDPVGKVHRMEVAVPRGTASILNPPAGDPPSYLRRVAEDMEAIAAAGDPHYQERMAYLLGTITFRRCR